MALRSNGTVVTWGRTTVAQPRHAALLRDVKAISAGFDHSLALKRDGTVVCWQDNSSKKQMVGQCNNVSKLKNIVDISAGRQFSLALDNQGRVYVWGSDAFGQLNITQNRTDVIKIRAGYVNAVVAYADGAILTTGSELFGARVSRTATSTGVITPSPAPATWTPAPPTFTPRPTVRR
jgi:alpha-tubulin suppressor-like RCC1 family protein